MQRNDHNRTSMDIDHLYKLAIQFSRTRWPVCSGNWDIGSITAIELNPGLQHGCPALQNYLTAFQHFGLTSLTTNTLFAWHGTPTLQNIASICHDGFDPNLRKRQIQGDGEYFGVNANDSHNFTGNSDRLIVAQIIKGSHLRTLTNVGCHVVTNPRNRKFSFTLPVLVVTYGNSAPLTIPWIDVVKGSNPPHYHFNAPKASNFSIDNKSWYWTEDGAKLEPYTTDVSNILESQYRNYQRGGPSTCRIGPIVRKSDHSLEYYVVDFAKQIQTNIRTGYWRNIKQKYGPQCSRSKGSLQKKKRKRRDRSRQKACSSHATSYTLSSAYNLPIVQVPRWPVRAHGTSSEHVGSESTQLLASDQASGAQTPTACFDDMMRTLCCCLF